MWVCRVVGREGVRRAVVEQCVTRDGKHPGVGEEGGVMNRRKKKRDK